MKTEATTVSSTRQVDTTFKKTSTPEDHNHVLTVNILRNTVMDEGPSSSKNSDKASSKNKKSKHNSIDGSISLANGAESESLPSGLNNMSLNNKHVSSNILIPKKTLAQYKPEKWMLPDKEVGEKDQLNLAIVSLF